MQRRSLSIFSIGWFNQSDVPPFFHPEVFSSCGRETGHFALFPKDGSWAIFIREMQRITPLLAHHLRRDGGDRTFIDSPIHNPYATGDLKEFVAFLEREARNHDLIVLGFCTGEGQRRIEALPIWIRRKTIVTHWDTFLKPDEAMLRRYEVLEVVPRQFLVGWLVERVQDLSQDTNEVAKEFLAQLEGSHATEVILASDGAGLGV